MGGGPALWNNGGCRIISGHGAHDRFLCLGPGPLESGKMCIHSSGPVRIAIRASTALAVPLAVVYWAGPDPAVPESGGPTATAARSAAISRATDSGNLPVLLAATLVMSLIVVTMNRTLWQKLYRLSATRYKLET